MDVAILGGHGKIALLLAARLRARGDAVRSLIRNPDHADEVRAAGGEPLLLDVERAGAQQLADALGAADAVVFAAGAGPGSGAARKETVDYGGAVKLIEACRLAGVARYVMVSAIGAAPDAPGDAVYAVYQRAKGRADAELAASGLAYTIVRPGPLSDEPATGRVALAERRVPISRADVAAVLAATLHEDALVGAAFTLVGGDTPIAEALAAAASG